MIREVCCILDRATHTPITFWLEQTPRELELWWTQVEKASKKLPNPY